MSARLMCAVPWLILVACLGASTPAWAAECSGPPLLEARLRAHPDTDAYAALGIWFGMNHKTDCAIRVFQSGLKLAPDSGRLNYLLGLGLYTAGRKQEAVAPLQQCTRLQPGEVRTHLLLGAALAGIGRDQEALAEWQTVLKIDPTSKEALDGMATILISIGDDETVIRRLRSIPRDENLTLDLAIAYAKSDMTDDAVLVLTEGLKIYPNSEELTEALESVYAQHGRYQDAATLAESFARRNPSDIRAQRYYLWMLVVKGNNDETASVSRELLARFPHDPEILTLSGILERDMGDYPAARKDLEEAVILRPNDASSRYNLGVVLAQLQDAAGAREQFEKAIDLGATAPEVHFELAKVLRTLGQAEEAQQQLKLYQQREEEDSDNARAELIASLAAQAVKAGDNRKAADLYREACAAQPNDARLAYRQALVLEDLGDIAAERTALESAIKADPGFVQAQYKLGYLDLKAGDNAAAERQFRLTVGAYPASAQAWVSLATALGAESRFQEAQDAVASALKLEPDNAAALELSKKLAAAHDRH